MTISDNVTFCACLEKPGNFALYTLKSARIFSILFPIHFLRYRQGELFFNNQELIGWVVVSCILIILLFDYVRTIYLFLSTKLVTYVFGE